MFRNKRRYSDRFILSVVMELAVMMWGGCEALPISSGEDSSLFFTQSELPDAHMDALFEGAVIRGEAGCLRLSSPEAPTVIWPTGFTLSDGGVVRDAEDQAIGRIGSEFRLPGGEVPSLHDGLAISDEVRSRAVAHCPGRYWIVGAL